VILGSHFTGGNETLSVIHLMGGKQKQGGKENRLIGGASNTAKTAPNRKGFEGPLLSGKALCRKEEGEKVL